MADSRTKNAARNIVFGSLNRFVSLVLPFVTRTIIIYLLGTKFLGIGTLFSSILSFLSLTELGFSSAMVYSMYKPIAEKDNDKICMLLNYYKKVYRGVGLAILFLGTVIVPFLPYLIKGEPPEGVNVYILYYIYLLRSVFSYFFYGYKQSLLTAHQRSDITSNMHTIISLVMQFSEIAVLYLTRNFYVYAFVPLIGSVVNNICLAIITQKRYPHLTPKGNIDDQTKSDIKNKISGLFGTRLNSIVVHSADTMVISAFIGLTMTAKYGNYYYIMNAVCGFVSVFYSSMTAGIGNKIVTESINENYKLFKNLMFVNAWIVGWASIAFLCLYEPFMKLWLGEEMQLGILFVVLLVLYFFVYEIQRPILTFKDAVGLWNKDKLRPYVSMSINLVFNLIFVQFVGIYGILISTILAFLVSVPWVNTVLYKNLFTQKKARENIFSIIKFFIITLITALPTYVITSLLPDTYWALIVRIVICLVVPNAILFLFYRKHKEFDFLKLKIKGIIKKKLL